MEKALCLISGTFIWAFVIAALYLNTVIGDGEDSRNYFNRFNTIDVGYVVERQLKENRVRIHKIKTEIVKLQKENEDLLKGILEANGISLKENEGCDLDLASMRFKFFPIKENKK